MREEISMLGTFLAVGAAIAVTGTVGAFLPHTQWGRFLSLTVFVYTMAPVARRTYLRHTPEKSFEKSYWTMSAIVVAVSSVLDALWKPPFILSATVVTFCIGGALVAWIVQRSTFSQR
jgi:hypothetical protein